MKKIIDAILAAITLLGIFVGLLGKTKSVKRTGYILAAGSGSALLIRKGLKEYKEVEKQCQETEKVFEETGLDPNNITTPSLLTGTEENPPIFGEILLKEIWNNSVFPNEMLEYCRESQLNTLHIMQNVDKNRIIVSIPIPKYTKGNLSPQDIREYYKNIFEDFIDENNLEMKAFLNQIGVVVTQDCENPPFTYFEEIVRNNDESFPVYIERVNALQKESENGKKPKDLVIQDGEKFLRIEQYFNLQFPVFPEFSNKRGLDLFLSVKLIKILTEEAYIPSKTGREIKFDLNRIAFHPTDDYGTILVIKEGKVHHIDL